MSRYIGFSFVGNPCSRFIWFKFRDSFNQNVTPELQAIFDTGNKLESEVIQSLKDSGEHVQDRDESKPDKQICVCPDNSYWILGYIDGLIERNGETMVLEIKSANDRNFKKMKRLGVVYSKPVYHTQLNCYLGLTGHEHGLWRVINKETGESFEEVLLFNKRKFDEDMKRARAIVEAPDVLPAVSNRFLCKYCDAKDICNGVALPEISCKTCRFYQVKNHEKYPRCKMHLYDKCNQPCEDFVYTDGILHLAGFSFEDENVYWDYKESHLASCAILVRDHFGNEYPLRGMDDCKALKDKMAEGWSPKCKLGY